MRQSPDELVPGAGRQLRVEIQSDDESNVLEARRIPCLDRELVVLIPQEAIEVQKLATFSLPAHPQLFGRVVLTMSVEMKQSSFVLVRVFLIELAQEPRAQLGQRFLLVELLGRVRQIGKQSKMKIPVAIGQKSDL